MRSARVHRDDRGSIATLACNRTPRCSFVLLGSISSELLLLLSLISFFLVKIYLFLSHPIIRFNDCFIIIIILTIKIFALFLCGSFSLPPFPADEVCSLAKQPLTVIGGRVVPFCSRQFRFYYFFLSRENVTYNITPGFVCFLFIIIIIVSIIYSFHHID